MTIREAMPVVYGFHSLHHSPMFGGTIDVLDLIAETGRAGYGAIGLDMVSLASYTAGGGSIAELGSAVVAAGLVCSDLVGVLGPDVDPDEWAREHAMRCSLLGASVLVAAVAPGMPLADTMAALDSVTRHCHGVGVRVGIEFSPYGTLETLTSAVSACESIGWDRVGLVLDPFHHFVAQTDLAEVRQWSVAISTRRCLESLVNLWPAERIP